MRSAQCNAMRPDRPVDAALARRSAVRPWGRLMAGQHGFTLIELLVVIAIIALLVSLLVPTLKRARELAKRAVCLSNTHNLHVAAMIYAAENDSVLPAPPDPNQGAGGWQGMLSGHYYYSQHMESWNQGDLGSNGWALLFDGDHLSGEGLVGCPAMDFDVADTMDEATGLGVFHYDYRYNGNHVLNADVPVERFLHDEPTWRVLFSDSAAYRLNTYVTGGTPYLSTTDWRFPHAAYPNGGARWAHGVGGHMVALGGSAAWVPTTILWPTGWDERGMGSWPTFWLMPLYQGASDPDLGLDILMRDN